MRALSTLARMTAQVRVQSCVGIDHAGFPGLLGFLYVDAIFWLQSGSQTCPADFQRLKPTALDIIPGKLCKTRNFVSYIYLDGGISSLRKRFFIASKCILERGNDETRDFGEGGEGRRRHIQRAMTHKAGREMSILGKGRGVKNRSLQKRLGV